MLRNVPGASSSLGLPATVTLPGLTACLNWRWLPRVAAKNQPAPSRHLITAPTFTTSAHSPPLQEQHRRAARGLRENTAFARDVVDAGAGDPVYTPHLVSSEPQSNRNAEVPCEDTSPLSRQAPQPEPATKPPAAHKAPPAASPARIAALEHRPLVLPGVPERPLLDPRVVARLGRRRQRTEH